MTRADVHHIYSGPESHRPSMSESDAHLAPSPCVFASLPCILCSRHPSTLLTTALQLTSMLGLGVSLRLPPLYASYCVAPDPGPGPGEADQAISCQLQPHCPMACDGTARQGALGELKAEHR